ncbi:MAG: GNAT family N-acetyltransferase [Candidatus Aminicenantales bacterium]
MEGNLGFSGSVGPGEPILRPMAAGDLPAVIELHRRLFPTASGRVFLAKSYYPAILDPRSTGFAFVEIDSGKVAGFLAGALDSRAWHRILVRRNIAGSLIAAVRVAFSGWSDLAQVLRPLRFLLSRSARCEGGWIFFVGVDEGRRNRGVAERLVAASVEHCRSRKLSRCWVRTLKTNDPMKRVLEKSGFRIDPVMSGRDDHRFVYFLDLGPDPRR